MRIVWFLGVGGKMSRVLAIGDLHEPFAHKDALKFVQAIADKYNTDRTVFMGDEVDSYWASRYAKDPAALSAMHEHQLAVKALKKWQEAFPEAMICESNHTVRPYKKASEAGLIKDFLKTYKEVYDAPDGWEWAERVKIDGTLYFHGETYSGASAQRNAAMDNMLNIVLGHLHAFAGISYVATQGGLIWGMNAGCLLDIDTYAFQYAKFMRHKPTLGVGVIVDDTPYWEPMKLKKSGRWVGR